MKLRPVVVYTVLRLLAFLVPFSMMMLFPAFQSRPWLAAIFAAIIGFSLSLLFLRRPLSQVSESIYERRTAASRDDRDEDIEDAVDDAAPTPREL